MLEDARMKLEGDVCSNIKKMARCVKCIAMVLLVQLSFGPLHRFDSNGGIQGLVDFLCKENLGVVPPITKPEFDKIGPITAVKRVGILRTSYSEGHYDTCKHFITNMRSQTPTGAATTATSDVKRYQTANVPVHDHCANTRTC